VQFPVFISIFNSLDAPLIILIMHVYILAVHFDDVKGLVQSHHIYLFLYRLLAMQMFRPRKKHASENHVFLVHGLFEFQ
jgi:hypothetical protein